MDKKLYVEFGEGETEKIKKMVSRFPNGDEARVVRSAMGLLEFYFELVDAGNVIVAVNDDGKVTGVYLK